MSVATGATAPSLLDNAAMSPRQIYAVGLCFILNTLDGFDALAIAFVAAPLARGWSIAPTKMGLLLSSSLVGMGIGSLVLAPLADKIGRKAVILIALALMTASMGLSAVTWDVSSLAICRLITGVGIGAMLPCAGVLSSEFSNARRRPLSVAVFGIGYSAGAAVGGALAGFLLRLYSWESIFIAGAVICGVMIPLVWATMPESVEYIVSSRRHPDALQKVNELLASFRQPPLAVLPLVDLSGVTVAKQSLLGRPLFGLTVILVASYLLFSVNFYFGLSWAPKFAADALGSDAAGPHIAAVIGVAGMVGGVAAGILGVFIGAIWSAILMFILASLSTFIFGWGVGDASIATAAAFGIGFGTTGGMISLYTAIARLYPPSVRGTGAGAIIGIGRAGGIAGPAIGGAMLGSGFTVATVCFVLALPPIVAAVLLLPLSRRTPPHRIAARGDQQIQAV